MVRGVPHRNGHGQHVRENHLVLGNLAPVRLRALAEKLKRLARIYQCNVGDLIDNGDFSHLDVATVRRKARPAITVSPVTDSGPRPPQARAAGMTSAETGKLSGAGRTGFISDGGQISLGQAEGDVDISGTGGSKPGPALSPAIIELCAVITNCGFSSDRFAQSRIKRPLHHGTLSVI